MVGRTFSSSLRLVLVGMLLVSAGTPNALRAICEHGDQLAVAVISHVGAMHLTAEHAHGCSPVHACGSRDQTQATAGLLADADHHPAHDHHHHRHDHAGCCGQPHPCDATVASDAIIRGDREAEPDLQLSLNLLATLTADLPAAANPSHLIDRSAQAHAPPVAQILPTIVLLV